MTELPGVAVHVLVLEDEAPIRRFLCTALRAEQCQVSEAGDGRQADRQAAERKPDLVIVDLGLPDGDGIAWIRNFRGWSAAPVLVLSARSGEGDKVAALDAGADDYLTKPFGVAELLARVRAQLRRARLPRQEAGARVRFGEVAVDLASRSVTRAGEPVHLTRTEFRLLGHLIANAGRSLTHRQLLVAVWGPECVEHSHYLRVYMAALRRKLERDPGFPQHLLTESGVGYRLVL